MDTRSKACFKCNEVKPLAEFYRHREMSDGHLGKCKGCTRRDVRSNRRIRGDHYKEYDRKRGNRWKDGYESEWRKLNPEKYKAHVIAHNAIRDGKLKREPCFMCGDEKVHGHHVDYSKPLDVIWLCPTCHKRIHAYEELANKIRSCG